MGGKEQGKVATRAFLILYLSMSPSLSSSHSSFFVRKEIKSLNSKTKDVYQKNTEPISTNPSLDFPPPSMTFLRAQNQMG